jgi:hypothetical protein
MVDRDQAGVLHFTTFAGRKVNVDSKTHFLAGRRVIFFVDKIQIPAGTSVNFNEPIKLSGETVEGWFFQYGGGGNFGWMVLVALQTAPDWEFG